MNEWMMQAVERQKQMNRQEFLNLFCPRLRQLDSDDRMRVLVYGAKKLGIVHKFKGKPQELVKWSLSRQGYFDKLAKEIGIDLLEEKHERSH